MSEWKMKCYSQLVVLLLMQLSTFGSSSPGIITYVVNIVRLKHSFVI